MFLLQPLVLKVWRVGHLANASLRAQPSPTTHLCAVRYGAVAGVWCVVVLLCVAVLCMRVLLCVHNLYACHCCPRASVATVGPQTVAPSPMHPHWPASMQAPATAARPPRLPVGSPISQTGGASARRPKNHAAAACARARVSSEWQVRQGRAGGWWHLHG